MEHNTGYSYSLTLAGSCINCSFRYAQTASLFGPEWVGKGSWDSAVIVTIPLFDYWSAFFSTVTPGQLPTY